jgi:hypothetical protein
MLTQHTLQYVTLRASTYKQLTQQFAQLKQQAVRERKFIKHSFLHPNKTHYAMRVVLASKNMLKLAA